MSYRATGAVPPVLHAAQRPLTAQDWANISLYAKAVKDAQRQRRMGGERAMHGMGDLGLGLLPAPAPVPMPMPTPTPVATSVADCVRHNTQKLATLPTLRLGARGEAVGGWQEELRHLGAAIRVDSVFGPATRAVTVAWQRKHGLVPDGVVGPRSWATMIQVHCARRAQMDAMRATHGMGAEAELSKPSVVLPAFVYGAAVGLGLGYVFFASR